MRLRGGKTRRRVAVDMGSWEYFAVPCKAGATLSIEARLIGKGSFNAYLLGLSTAAGDLGTGECMLP